MERTSLEQWKGREVARLLSLVESERRYYQEIVASLPVGLVVLKSDRTIVSANRAFRQSVGLRNEELRSRTIEQLFPSNELIERIRKAHVEGDREAFYVEAGDSTFRVAIVPSHGWGDEGDPETILLIQNVSEIEARTGGFRAVAPTGLPAIVWRAQADTLRFHSVAGAVEELSGYAPAHWTLTADFFWTRIHPEDLPQVKAVYNLALDKGGDATAEFRLIRPAGEPIWLRETIRMVASGAGVRTISGIATDVTERKQLESQILAAGRVEAIQGLSARLAHDLNNPLMIINGYGEDLLASFPEQDARRGDVEEILTASQRLTELSSHLLGFTRQRSQAPAKVSLAKAISEFEDAFRQDAAHPRLITESSTNLLAVANAEQLAEILSAVASSAVNLSLDPTELHVSASEAPIHQHIGSATLSPGLYVRIDFRTVASGLAETAPAAPFETVLPSKDPQQTHQVILARAYGIVREWGGDLTFARYSQGALLSLYLAGAVPEVAPAPSPVEPPLPGVPSVEAPVPEPEPLRETILLVDDEAGIRGLVRRILRRERYNVIEAGNGSDALALAKQHSGAIDVLLTDVMMPGMSGPELAASVKASYPNAKVIFISGYSQISPTKDQPGAFLLQKPFTMTDLLRVVRQAIESNGPNRPHARGVGK